MRKPLFLPLILASTSVYRRELLERLNIPFSCVSPGVREEPIAGEPPPERALRLAQAKARAVSAQYPQAVVIGSDQVCAAGERVLGKPGDAAAARAQLAALSGSEASFHTACAVMGPTANAAKPGEARPLLHLDRTIVRFRALDAGEIARYVELDRPLDCAGGFKVESAGIALFTRVASADPTALTGLPLIFVADALRRFGYQVP